MIRGTPKFNGIAIAQIEINYLQTPMSIDVQAAFVNTTTGDTHAWEKGGVSWSDKTRGLIHDLRTSMEQDLAARHFSGGGTEASTVTSMAAEKPGGLGEHLGAVSVGAKSV